MKQKTNILGLVLLLIVGYANAQLKDQNYKRALNGIEDTWHKLTIPDEVFEKAAPDLSDIRIYGLTASDTIEAPYVLQSATEKIVRTTAAFELLNTSHDAKGYYYTFKLGDSSAINEIKLNFNTKNYDWRLELEGSHHLKKWFTITEDYRVLAIVNANTNYEYATLNFPKANYRYYRVLVKSTTDPNLTSAVLTKNQVTAARYKNHAIKETVISQDTELNKTVIDIKLNANVPISLLKFSVADAFDYYRPIRIDYLSDSIKTEKGWRYKYQNLSYGTLSSIEKNNFTFSSTVLKQLRITVTNGDNQPLQIKAEAVKGYVHELVARFTVSAKYYFSYGNNMARFPSYDIGLFSNKIPDNLKSVSFGEEQIIPKEKIEVASPLFENQNWLWAVMGVIIILLGWFSIKMLSKKE